MRKQIAAMLLVLCLLTGLLPATASADDGVLTGQCGDTVSWFYNQETKVLTIEGTGKMQNLDTVDDAEGTYLFGRHSSEVFNAERIIISDGVTHIGDRAFQYCNNVISVEISHSVKSIGYCAFSTICPWYCETIACNTDVVINDILFYTPKTGDIVIEEPISSVAGGAIKNATSVYFGESVEIISDGAVNGANLKSITVMNPNCAFSYTIAPTTIGGFYGESAWGDVAWDIVPGVIVNGYPNSTAQEFCELVNSFWAWSNFLAENPWTFSALNVEHPFTDVPAGSWFEAPVLWALENGITSGTSDTSFSPSNKCLRAHVVTFLWKAEGSPAPTVTSEPFDDVNPSDYFHKSVLWAVENNITSGVSPTKFGATNPCSRYQVVFFLWRAAGSPEPKSTTNPFTDVKPTDFFYKSVLWAVENNITSGITETEFGPTNPCSRAQVVTFLYKAYN